MKNISKMGASGNSQSDRIAGWQVRKSAGGGNVWDKPPQSDLWERSALGLGYSISRKISQSSISVLEDNGSKSIDLPGSVSEMKDELNNYSTCVVKNTSIDEQSDQITPANESFMKRLSMRIKQLLPFRQLTMQNRNDPTLNEVILTSFSQRKKRERIGRTSEDHMPEAKAYIPYESARFHIAKVVEDMHQLRNKYIKHICEMEESLHTPEKEKKEQSILKLQKQHRDKMTIFKEVLKAYQEHIKKNNKYWEDLVQHLKNENNQLIQEQIQAKQELEKWEYQKTKIIEGFSQKIDLLYTHQISTLKELHITRLELERVQEMLKLQEEIVPEKQEKNCLQATSEIKISDDPDFEVQENCSQEVHEQRQNLKNCINTLGETEHTGNEKWATVIGLPEETQEKEVHSSAAEASKEYFQEKACMILPSLSKKEDNSSGTDQTKIAEAQMILEKLKQTLSKKEEEIAELLQDEGQPDNHFTTWTKNQLVHSDPSNIFLLKKILEKFHSVYSEVPEARQFIDCLLNENNGKVITAKETLKRLQQNVIDSEQVMGGNPTDFNRFQFPKDPDRNLEDVQAELWEAEMAVGALGSISSGCINEQLYSIVTGAQWRVS
ncbi:putative leucine-rich repeat-containing protein DDB_G0290503 isoform X1 [Hypanus sabinus]|uniref:putative leucine-rich repeat-containing protein DDB_G0290503 isoform X1 n=1 Tax=Hypanus sabinus TaxID=79690 RepID=UPI0028C3D7B2|nr:putative leucine-rich repeat-containing protein DDB_G0290503 isoform X1 [Hypanus sabinus]XP_059825685.1 putative leucine-rich repeat-containing protein DDB_G0290503 isoform X1 [Hypanus sabinus]